MKQKTTATACGCSNVFNIFVAYDDYWYIARSTNLCHTGHPSIPQSAKLLGMDDISENDSAFIAMCNDAGIGNNQIAKMLELLHGRESGTFLTQTLYNYNVQTKLMSDIAKGIKPNMTDAERTLKLLRV